MCYNDFEDIMEKYTTLGIDKIKKVKEVKDASIYYKSVLELEANSSAHFKPEIKEDNRQMMFRDLEEWEFYTNDEDLADYLYYFMMKARYILKNLKRDNHRYKRSIELKKYWGILPPEFEFVKKNLTFINWCTRKTDLGKYKLVLGELYINKLSMRKFVNKYKAQGWTIKKLQKAKTELFSIYIECLSNNAYKMKIADVTFEQFTGHPFSQDPNDLDTMRQQLAELINDLKPATFEFESAELEPFVFENQNPQESTNKNDN